MSNAESIDSLSLSSDVKIAFLVIFLYEILLPLNQKGISLWMSYDRK